MLSDKMRLQPTIETMKMLKALDNQTRILIVQLVLNSSPVSFSRIHEYIQEKESTSISKGTISYHLDLLIEGGILKRELKRTEEKEYSRYDITPKASSVLQALNLVVLE